jgi:hypothetical protein
VLLRLHSPHLADSAVDRGSAPHEAASTNFLVLHDTQAIARRFFAVHGSQVVDVHGFGLVTCRSTDPDCQIAVPISRSGRTAVETLSASLAFAVAAFRTSGQGGSRAFLRSPLAALFEIPFGRILTLDCAGHRNDRMGFARDMSGRYGSVPRLVCAHHRTPPEPLFCIAPPPCQLLSITGRKLLSCPCHKYERTSDGNAGYIRGRQTHLQISLAENFMPDQSPNVRCPSCGHSFVAASNPQPENGVRASASSLPPFVLRSWKEIACYVRSGVRTAQRWERDLGLPVRRSCGHARGSVMAFPAELEAWLHRSPTAVLNQSNLTTTVPLKQSV